MWKIYSKTALIGLLCVTVSPSVAIAQTVNYNTNSSSGIYLPAPPRSQGFDEVRTSDGTTCRSSMSGNGAVFDLGTIGREGIDGEFDGTVYGRLVIPLGMQPGRIDCTQLYQLEIERLKLQVQALKAGSVVGHNPDAGVWNND